MFVNSLTPEPSAEYVLANYIVNAKKNQVRGADMQVEFGAHLPKLERDAFLTARRTVSPTGQIHYDILKSSGDASIKKEVIARYIANEVEPSAQMPTDMAISPENYKFKSKGWRERGGRKSYVFEVNPRKKRVGLFKGEIWVDAETGLTVRESGKLAKSPSVFLKDVEFTREFALRDGFSIPVRVETKLQTRFWGPALLRIDFTDFAWSGSLASATPLSTTASVH